MKTTLTDCSTIKSPNQTSHDRNRRAKNWLLSGFALLFSSAGAQADDTFSTAIAIETGDTVGAFSSLTDLDYYKLTISSAQVVTIASKAASIGTQPTQLRMQLYDSRASEGYLGYDGFNSAPVMTELLQAGTYYIRIEPYTYAGAYRLVLNTQSSAIPITSTIQGNLDVPYDRETYMFTVTTPGYVMLRARRPRITTPAINIQMVLRNEIGERIGDNFGVSSGSDAGYSIILDSGNYFVTISSEMSGDFDLKITTSSSAVTIGDGVTRGLIDLPRDHDYYRFVVTGNVPRTVSFVTSGTAALNLWIQNEFGQSKSFFGFPKIFNHDDQLVLDPGTYYLLVYGNEESGVGAFGNYNLTLSGTAPIPAEIVIFQPTTRKLADGKSKSNFNTVIIGNTKGITYTFLIKNLGERPLTGIKLTKGGKHASEFQINTQPAKVLVPGKHTTFKVTFLPKTSGDKNAWLRVASNDADENPFDISVIGKGVKRPTVNFLID